MEKLISLTKLLPSFNQIEPYLGNDAEAGYTFLKALQNMINIKEGKSQPLDAETERAACFVNSLANRYWDMIHADDYSEAGEPDVRKAYGMLCFFKIFHMLFESLSHDSVDHAYYVLDEAYQLDSMPSHLYPGADGLRHELSNFLDECLADYFDFELHVIQPLTRQNFDCDIQQIECPSIETFQEICLGPRRPALLLNTFTHWPALTKWRDLNYILKVAGNRVVPIESGSCISGDWSSYLSKVRDFLLRQFALGAKAFGPIECMADHNIFEQIPALKADIDLPDYCAVDEDDGVDVKAWLGPENTVTPLHMDRKSNLLCQVFGMKKIILAAPSDGPFLYLTSDRRVSYVDVEHLDLVEFPLADRVQFYHIMLQEGDCLYIPPGWFHYVRALTDSCSVGFWWD